MIPVATGIQQQDARRLDSFDQGAYNFWSAAFGKIGRRFYDNSRFWCKIHDVYLVL